MAFAFFFDAVAIKFSWVGGGNTSLMQGTRVPRPVLGPWDFADDRAFLVLAVVVFIIVSIVVVQIRGGTIGRTLRAIRGSEVAAQSIGISPARARVVAFAVSAAIAALGGALLSIHQKNVNYGSNFSPVSSLFWLVLVVSLGARTIEGAALAGAAFSIFDPLILRGTIFGWILRSPKRVPGFFPISPKWRLILFGLGTLQFARHPEGAVEFWRGRTSRWLAARQQSAPPAPDEPTESIGVDGAVTS
ncbi:unannotated protein [freshwater metagenome]|uniref:Unannotated protein n=1 Tax=freshwater metagenome TaxID=449393 RepID=A0A6J6AC67_9ZZZZ